MIHRTRRYRPPGCTCRNSRQCGYCPGIAIDATRQAGLPAGSPARVAADRLARRYAR